MIPGHASRVAASVPIQSFPRNQIQSLFAKDPLTVIDHGSRQSFDAAKLLQYVGGCNCQRIMHPDLLRKLYWIPRVHHDVRLTPYDGKSARAIAVEEFLITWHFFLARLAPRCPNVNEHHLAAKVGRRDLVSLQVLQCEIR